MHACQIRSPCGHDVSFVLPQQLVKVRLPQLQHNGDQTPSPVHLGYGCRVRVRIGVMVGTTEIRPEAYEPNALLHLPEKKTIDWIHIYLIKAKNIDRQPAKESPLTKTK